MDKATLSPEVQESVETARDIASTELVNIEAGADYLHGRHPEVFRTWQDAIAAIRGEPAQETQPTQTA